MASSKASLWPLALALLGLAPTGALAQGATQNGRTALAAALDKAELRKRLTAEENLSLYVGRIRVGSLSLTSSEAGKGLVLSDYFELRLDGVGQASMNLRQTIDEAGRLLDAKLETRSPSPTGRVTLRTYTIKREDGGFRWRKTINGQVTERVIDAPPQALVLAPPLGLSARLPKAIKDSGNFAWSGIDLETGASARLRLSAEPMGEIAFRSRKVAAKPFVRRECAALFKVFVAPQGGLLAFELQEGRLRMVGGIEEGERYEALPDAVSGAPKTPIETVIVFFRALGKNEEETIAACLDFDALFEAAKSSVDEAKGERAAFREALMATFRDEKWLTDHRLSVNGGALEPSEMKASVEGDQASVLLPGGGKARLAKRDGRWRITRFEAPKSKG